MGTRIKKVKRVVVATVWVSIAVAVVVFLIAAMQKRDDKVCKGINIEIVNEGNNLFADKNDIRGMIKYMNIPIEGKPISEINLQQMETLLEKNTWIKNAELYFDNNEKLQVKVTEREPMARIFTTSGKSYYLDSDLVRLSLSSRFSALVPVFTGCPLDKAKWNAADSVVLRQVKDISAFVANDEFWMAQVAQIDYNKATGFEVIPTIGNHRVILGNANDLQVKFDKLFVFYREVLAKTSWDKYKILDVRFKEQVVATRN